MEPDSNDGDEKSGIESGPTDEVDVPAIFATIHFRSPRRPNGYTMAQIAKLNRLAGSRPRQ